jgi:thioredoxin reductase (NADPH)
LERLARTSADIHLAPGEFAVPEGGERALFAVLSGKIEVVKTIDGIERRLGFRLPGTIFGEVPIALGTPFPGDDTSALPDTEQIALQTRRAGAYGLRRLCGARADVRAGW